MLITVAQEPENETRIALTPQAAKRIVGLGAQVKLPTGYGASLGFSQQDYEKAGATLDGDGYVDDANMVIGINPPDASRVEQLGSGGGKFIVSLLDPFRNTGLVQSLAQHRVSAFCMELIPRTTYAQKMDVLSSQASLAGYAAVIKAADRIAKSFPMMSTPAGTIPPARVLVIGAGVAGLQAIATAKRLGARVEAYDTRPVVEEQVQSLGAKFLKIDVGETGQTAQGYAKELTEEQLAKQQAQLAKFIAGADVVITTAQVFGRDAPRIVSAEMVAGMRAGSVIVDLAASTGGNVAGTVADQEVMVDGVCIIGLNNFPGEVARDASQVYANNVANLLEHVWDKETKQLKLDLDDEITGGVLLTHEGQVRDDRIVKLIESSDA
jgi:NAD(P) transhydrogenase subunit alpha